MQKTPKGGRRVDELLRAAARAWARDPTARRLARLDGGDFFAEVAFVQLARRALDELASLTTTQRRR
jgi:hypothetical protein